MFEHELLIGGTLIYKGVGLGVGHCHSNAVTCAGQLTLLNQSMRLQVFRLTNTSLVFYYQKDPSSWKPLITRLTHATAAEKQHTTPISKYAAVVPQFAKSARILAAVERKLTMPTFIYAAAETLCTKSALIQVSDANANRVTGVVQWREHSTPTNAAWVRFSDPAPYVGWVCCWFSPCSERIFSGYSGFPLSSNTNIYKFQFDLERTVYV